MTSFKTFKTGLAAILLLVSVILGFPAAQASEDLRIVPTDKVCMVTNMVFPRAQIPVPVQGKTYYGCCENCKETLAKDAKSRLAVDPVSGKSIDKATAVIAARADDSVVYFESKNTFEQFKKRTLKK